MRLLSRERMVQMRRVWQGAPRNTCISQGFNATEANADQISSLTTIFAYSSKPHTIAFLANLMNVASTDIYYSYDPSVGVDIVVNLGRDWAYTNPSQ